MRFAVFSYLLASLQTIVTATSVQGLYDLVQRRLPGHSEEFVFTLNETTCANSTDLVNDSFTVATGANGSIAITGNSLSALATGLRRYLTEVAHTDVYWFIDSRLDEITTTLPRPNATITGSSIVPWRYYFNTVTFSYTTPFWSWEDWEKELDWLALHGVNLPLAWVGFEKILLDVFQSINMTTSEIMPFFSGPAFQAWNRFGNIQGSWGGELPLQWIDSQFELQQKILKRMLELGMTPILPAFTGFVPRTLTDVYPNATVVNGSQWEGFPTEYTNTTFLAPSDPLFTVLQNLTIVKQIEYYGNITQYYTLDQYNENDPFSGDLDYLRNVTRGTWQSLKSANAAAVWVMQGWLFTSNADFWTNERIEAYLSGVEVDSDMLILDLFSESQPEWQRTNSYYGKPWIWNMLHNYGGNMGLYGQIANVTINPIEALANSSSLVGFGLTPEGQQGNEIMYKLLLDQAWKNTPIDTSSYFRSWAQTRYAEGVSVPTSALPSGVTTAWELLRTSAYNNQNLSAGNAVSKAIYELAPNITKLTNRTGHHPTTVTYDPQIVIQAWNELYRAATQQQRLWESPGFEHDFVDVTRQVFSNAFLSSYESLISTWTASTIDSPPSTKETLLSQAETLISLLHTLDAILATLPQFSLEPWISSARSWALLNTNTTSFTTSTSLQDQNLLTYNAINQLTLWGPTGQINDYASKSWAGLVAGYYVPRWETFLEYLVSVAPEGYRDEEARARVVVVEMGFQKKRKEKRSPWRRKRLQYCTYGCMHERQQTNTTHYMASKYKPYP
ncbi:putative alpha-N-acetylglucosaminidase [Massarina eburnea CBS 473.64]|uniref:Putative alpha-N-acetylglucosaminidase n=1 Tax=Massarina eburnea CBS 473.64 TaxID=1395130 RepID=A0A6A6RNB0_9PLEO|nr:putative alpha-N-acetylglucosaminidase [Massarina eburnea CBS 473.64]